MVEANRFDADERLTGLQRPEILDFDGEHLWPAGAAGASDATLRGKT
jgi:hypothetical protein